MTTDAPSTARLLELADNYEYLAGVYRGDEEAESIRCADIATALRALCEGRKFIERTRLRQRNTGVEVERFIYRKQADELALIIGENDA